MKRTRARSRSQIQAVASKVETIIAYALKRRRPAARSSIGTESSEAPVESAEASGCDQSTIAAPERAEARKTTAEVRAIAQEWVGCAQWMALRLMARAIPR